MIEVLDTIYQAATDFGPWVVLCGALVWHWMRRDWAMREDIKALARKCDASEKFIRDELASMQREMLTVIAANTEAFTKTDSLLSRLGSCPGITGGKRCDRCGG